MIRAASWLQLRVVGESNIAKLTILFPIIGWILAYDDKIASYLFLKGLRDVGGGSYAAPMSFYYMYFGLLLFGIASIIFQIFCPTLVKESTSKNDYIGKFLLYKNQGRVESLLQDLERHNIASGTKDVLSVKILKTLGVVGQSENALTHVLDIYFEKMNGSNPSARMCCTILYSGGAIILIVPTMLTSISILLGVFRSL